jgi:hypothetical protein
MRSERREEVGKVEVEADEYIIVSLDAEHYQVVRSKDDQPVGRFRGTPTLMWLLEPESIEIDLLRCIVRSAIIEGLVVDMATD